MMRDQSKTTRVVINLILLLFFVVPDDIVIIGNIELLYDWMLGLSLCV